LATEDPAVGEREQHQVIDALLGPPGAADKIGAYFYNKTLELITANKLTLVGGKSQCVDIVRHVLRHVPIYWVATEIVRFLFVSSGSKMMMFLARLAFH
jgi:linoleate 10R-lipoxygenase